MILDGSVVVPSTDEEYEAFGAARLPRGLSGGVSSSAPN